MASTGKSSHQTFADTSGTTHWCALAHTRYEAIPNTELLSVLCPRAPLTHRMPTTLQSPDGRVTQGYFITAYRNLTSVSDPARVVFWWERFPNLPQAMIQDLKADSARWELERRAASRSSGAGGTMHSSQPNGMSVRRNSNSPLGSREPRGQDSYAAWKTQLREQQEFQPNYASAMEVEYATPAGAAANPGYAGQQFPGGPAANYTPATYPPQGQPVLAAQYQHQPGYGYAPNPPPAQYSPQPQTGADRYSAIPPPPMPASYGQDPSAFIHGGNYQAAGGYSAAGPNRMPPAMPHVSAAPPRTYNAPTAGTPVFGSEADPYAAYPPPGTPTPQGYPTDALYGRGAYTTATTKPPEASSDVLGSPAGAPQQRPGYVAPPDPQYDDPQNPGLKATTPTTTAPPQMPPAGAPAARRDRDSEPRERERDHRDHRTRRSEPERDDRHADRNRHRHR
jgi:hypothetical protein